MDDNSNTKITTINDSLKSWGFSEDTKWTLTFSKIQSQYFPADYPIPSNPVRLRIIYKETATDLDEYYPFIDSVFNIGGKDGTITYNGVKYTVVAIGGTTASNPMFANSTDALFYSKKHLATYKIKFSQKCKVIKIDSRVFKYSKIICDPNEDFYIGDSVRWLGIETFNSIYFDGFSLNKEFNLNQVSIVEKSSFDVILDYQHTTGDGNLRRYAIQKFNLGSPDLNEPFGNLYDKTFFGSTIVGASPQTPIYIRWNLRGSPSDYSNDTFSDGMFSTFFSSVYTELKNSRDCQVLFEILSSGFTGEGADAFFEKLRSSGNGYSGQDSADTIAKNVLTSWTQFSIPYNDESIRDWGLTSGGLILSNEHNNNVSIIARPSTTFNSLKVHDTITFDGVTYNVIRLKEECFKNCGTPELDDGQEEVEERTLTFINDSEEDGQITRNFNIAEFGRGTFTNVKFTGDLILPEGIRKIGSYSFQNCEFEDGALSLPSTLDPTEGIFHYAFDGDKFVGELKIPSSISAIGDGAFKDCTGFTTVILENNVTTIGTWAFANMSSVKKLYINGWASLNNKKIYGINDGNSGSEAAKPFDGWPTSLADSSKRQIITNCVSNIKNPSELGIDNECWEIFANDGELSAIAANAFWSALDNNSSTVKFAKLSNNSVSITKADADKTFAFDSSVSDNVVVFPDTVTIDDIDYSIVKIEANTFANCSGINKTIKFNKSLNTIGLSAFANSGITGIQFDTASVLESIADDAFVGCASLEGNIIFPNTLKSIGLSAFRGCTKLGTTSAIATPALEQNTIVLPNGIEYIGSGAFGNCPNITGKIDLHQLSYLGEGVFSGDAKLSEVNLEHTKLTTLNNNIFNNCTGLSQELVLPWTIASIGNQVFYNCSNLQGILNIPSEVVSIGARAFANCTGLVGDLIIPHLTKTIGTEAFVGCTGLTGKLQMYENIREISTNAFNGLENITSIVLNWDKIHPSQMYIADEAFGGLFSAASHQANALDGNISIVGNANNSDTTTNSADVKRYVHIPKESEVTISQLKGLDGTIWEIKKDVDKFDDPMDDEVTQEVKSNEAKINVAFILVGVLSAVSIGAIAIAGVAFKKNRKSV